MECCASAFRRSTIAALGLAVGLLFGHILAGQEQPGPARPKFNRPAPTSQQLADWIKELDADEFLARETAMLSLIDAGPPAIEALRSQALPARSVEAATRVMHVLEQLGLSPEFDVQEQARAALLELAARKEMPQIARRAAAALDVLTERRAAQSVSELEALGAKISHGQSFNGLGIEEFIESIEIGPDFTGTELDLRRLKWLPDVELLILASPMATDAWLKQAAAMERLSELHLYEAAVSDAGLAVFADHAALTQLGIYYTPITDEALEHLQKLPALNFLKLYGTKVNRPAVEKFQAATGLAKVDHRKGAFLGVGCQNLDGACLISTVHENSPAQKAGLERDDQLVRFGDVKTADFDALTAEISQRDVGEMVEIEVQRQVLDDQGNIVLRAVVLKVKLGPWEQDLAVRNGMRP